MLRTDMIRVLGLLLATVTLGGCFSFKGSVPDVPGWGGPPPPATVVSADPNSKPDVIRENSQLRERVAWLEKQIQGRKNKVQKLQQDEANTRRDIDRLNGDLRRYQ